MVGQINEKSVRLAILVFALAFVYVSGSVPAGLERAHTSYDWCDCGKGLKSVKVWLDGHEDQARTIPMNSSMPFNFSMPVKKFNWICDSMTKTQEVTLPSPAVWFSVLLTTEIKGDALFCKPTASGRLKWNSWSETPYPTSVPFSSYEDGYACMKIPSLLETAKGTLIALAEARTPDCGDFSRTDLVYKRSTDGGLSWSELNLLVKPEPGAQGVCGNPVVVGNAAPVQLSVNASAHPGRILIPHTRNNFAVWTVHSDDDGLTWSTALAANGNVTHVSADGPDCNRNMSYFGVKDPQSLEEWVQELGWSTPGGDPYTSWRKYLQGDWQFIGLGPPGSLELTGSGRILVPAYHSYIRGLSGGGGQGAGVNLPVSQLYNNFALGHVMLSDDGGDSWHLGSAAGFGGGSAGEGANEDQLVELRNGSVLLNSRSLSTGSPQQRVQCRSDDGGETFTPTRIVPELPEPFNGCQGSVTAGSNGTIFLSHPNPQKNEGIAPAVLAILSAILYAPYYMYHTILSTMLSITPSLPPCIIPCSHRYLPCIIPCSHRYLPSIFS
jgi:hypothetical protein